MSEEFEAMERELDRRRKAKEREQERERKGIVKNAHLTGYSKNEREHNCQYKIKIRLAFKIVHSNQSIYHLNFREDCKSSLLKLLNIFISYFLIL